MPALTNDSQGIAIHRNIRGLEVGFREDVDTEDLALSLYEQVDVFVRRSSARYDALLALARSSIMHA